MRESIRVKLVGMAMAVAVGGVCTTLDAEEGQASGPAPAGQVVALTPTVAIPSEFGGTWDYNHLESINILTGRPEQTPRSATAGGGRGSTPPPRSGGGGTTGGGRGAGGFGGGGDFGAARPPIPGSGIGPTPAMMREQRDMSRDLLEVPEQYRIALGSGEITFTDDIERERTYAIDGKKQKYRLGASEFNARVEWDGTQLRKEIEGALGFRMTEVYFLSPDAKRLFVIVRVGQPSRNRQQSGFNRVYDRIEPSAQAEAALAR